MYIQEDFLKGIIITFIEEIIQDLKETNLEYKKCYKEQRESGKRFDELKL